MNKFLKTRFNLTSSKFPRNKIIVVLVSMVIGLGFLPLMAEEISNSIQDSQTSDTSTVTTSTQSPNLNESSSPASELSPSPNQNTSPQPQTTESTQSPPSPESEVSSSAGSTSTPSPTKTPPHPLENQFFVLQIPSVVNVDPRSRQINFPFLTAYGSSFTLVCLNSSGPLIDLLNPGAEDLGINSEIAIEGDRSKNVLITGDTTLVMSLLNGNNGLRLFSSSGVANSLLLMRFIAVSEPVFDWTFCDQGSAQNSRQVQIRGLGLEFNTKKNAINLGKKK